MAGDDDLQSSPASSIERPDGRHEGKRRPSVRSLPPAAPDPYLDDVRRQLLRLVRHLHRLDRGSLVQIANHADAVLERLDAEPDPEPQPGARFSTLRRAAQLTTHMEDR